MKKISKIEEFVYSDDIVAERHTFFNKSPANLKTHKHDVYQLGITFRDPGYYYVGEYFYKIKKGSFFCFSPNLPHASIGKLKNKILHKSITVYLSGRIFQLLNSQHYASKDQPHFDQVFYEDPELLKRFTLFFDAVWSQNHTEVNHQLQLLFIRLMHNKKVRRADTKKHKIVMALKSYVFSHIDRQVSLKDFAKLNAVSMSTLSRIFRNSIGMSPHVYVNQLRIQAAKKLLKTKLPIKEIARQTGHFDQSHLRKNFKQYIGVPPSGYKIRN